MSWNRKGLSSRLHRLSRGMVRQSALLRHGLLAMVLGLLASGHEAWGERRAPLELLRREFQRRQTGDVLPGSHWKWYILGFLAFVAVLGVVVWIVDRFRSRRPYTSRWLLFLELCWVHRLGWRQIWQLWQWVRREKIHPPARVFSEPELWEGRVDFVTLAAGGRDSSPWTPLYERCFGRLIPTSQAFPEASSNGGESPPRAGGN